MPIDICFCFPHKLSASRSKLDDGQLGNAKAVKIKVKLHTSTPLSVAVPKALQAPSSPSKRHLLDEKVPNLIQSPPIQATSSERTHANDQDSSSDISSAVSIPGTRIVSLISTERSESRLSSSTQRDSLRLPSMDDSRPPPPYSRNPPSLPHNELPIGFMPFQRTRSRSITQDDFRNYVQHLRQRLPPEGVCHTIPAAAGLSESQSLSRASVQLTGDSESISSYQTFPPQAQPFLRSLLPSQRSASPTASMASRSPSPPNAPVISRLTTPSTLTAASDRDSLSVLDLNDGEVPDADFTLFPCHSRTQQQRSSSPPRFIQQQNLLQEAQEGLFEQLDQRMRFEAWRASASQDPGQIE